MPLVPGLLRRRLELLAGFLFLAVAVAAGPSLRAGSHGSVSRLSAADESGQCTFDHSGFDTVLRRFVKPSRLVEGIHSSVFDYEALLASSDDSLPMLRNYVATLGPFQPSCLSTNGKLAFWANAYNALIIHLVLSDAGVSGGRLPKSIKDLHGNATSVWQRRVGIVAGKAMTLETVLSEGRGLGDPRIHAAVNCASLSCPDLRASAYGAEDVQKELDTQVKKWLSNPTKGAKIEGDRVLVSHIFDWHAEDFKPSVSYFLAGALGLSSSVEVSGYLPYNWDLNAERSSSEG